MGQFTNVSPIKREVGNVFIGHWFNFRDMLGINERTPKHAKRYANLGQIISDAVASYAQDVEVGAFPTDAHSFHRPMQ